MDFHHLGMASLSILDTSNQMALMGYRPESPAFEDQKQGVRGQFLVSPSGPRVEILENLDGRETLNPWLRRSAPMYHMGFEVNDFGKKLHLLKNSGAKQIGLPSPAVAFGGRMICFLLLPTRAVIEIIER